MFIDRIGIQLLKLVRRLVFLMVAVRISYSQIMKAAETRITICLHTWLFICGSVLHNKGVIYENFQY